jgi:8-oxo-dGTP pyrophosphatase MutT (NUDIX family)
LLVVRDAPAPVGVEVLVLRRSALSRFAPGFVVFPGGAVEAGDRELAVAWFGGGEHVDRACALRELREEAGLELLPDGTVGTPPDPHAVERPIDPAWVPEIGHWIAPSFLPMRFDARFFAARARRDATPAPDGVEIEGAWWDRPEAVLEAHRRGEAALMWPTLKMLEALTACSRADEVLALHIPQVEPPLAWTASALGRAAP